MKTLAFCLITLMVLGSYSTSGYTKNMDTLGSNSQHCPDGGGEGDGGDGGDSGE